MEIFLIFYNNMLKAFVAAIYSLRKLARKTTFSYSGAIPASTESNSKPLFK